MRAVIQRRYGGSDQLELAEIEAPEPGPGEVLVRVRAAGVDRGTWHLMTGLPYAVRLGFGLRRPKTPIPGRDVAGVVEAVGPGVTGVAAGEEVMGTADGSFAELALVPQTRLTRKPAGLSFEEAAALPISGGTALQAVRDVARVRPGQRVLVLGASGGVGSYAVQIAVAHGGEVTGMASAAKADFVRKLGATHVLDYAHDEIGADGVRYDVILDIAGQRPLRTLRRALTDRGTLVILGGEGGDRWLGGTHRQLAAIAWSPVVRQRLTMLLAAEKGEIFAALATLVAQGLVHPHLDRSYPLSDAARALDDLEAGRVRGKAVLVP